MESNADAIQQLTAAGINPIGIERLTSVRDGKIGAERRDLEQYALRYLLFARWLKEHHLIMD